MPAHTTLSRDGSTALRRGFACLSCRNRKLKCDAGRPHCSQCSKANRSQDCQYDDGRTRTRTEKLQDRIKELESLVQTYEAALSKQQSMTQTTQPYQPSAVPLFSQSSASLPPAYTSFPPTTRGSWSPPYAHSDHSSSYGSDSHHHPFHPSSSNSPSPMSAPEPLPYLDVTSSSSAVGSPSLNSWSIPGLSDGSDGAGFTPEHDWETEELPEGIHQGTLIQVFIGHRHQAHFEVDIDRFMTSLSLPHGSAYRPHPCLLNAMYLFASHFSRSELLAPHEPTFLARARAGITAALEAGDRVVNAIQASCLVALWLFFKGRVLEGYWMGCATSRLALGCGLHKITSSVWKPNDLKTSRPATPNDTTQEKFLELPPPRDSIEHGERIHLFWQVWCVEKYGVISTALPASLCDEGNTNIDTVLPRSLHEYKAGTVTDIDDAPIRSIYEDGRRPQIRPDSVAATACKALELFTRSLKIYQSGTGSETFSSQVQILDTAIARFATTMPPPSYVAPGDVPMPDGMRVHPRMVFPHTLVLCATIRLHSMLAPQVERSYNKCLYAGNEAMKILHSIKDYDFNYLEVALTACWKLVSEVFLRHVKVLNSTQTDSTVVARYQSQADASDWAMKRVCHLYAAIAQEQRAKEL